MSDEIKKAEQRGYSRGYQAGQKRKRRKETEERKLREERAFRDRAFLAALPVCMTIQGWKFGDKPISSAEDRVELAWRFAERAVRERRFH